MNTWTAAAIVGALALPCAACAQEAPDPDAPQIRAGQLHLSATGSVSAAPDMARVTAGVVAEAPTASEAMADQRTRMTAVIEALSDAGIEARDIQTTGLSLSPVYASYERRQDSPRITSYRASNRVTVIARDLTTVGPTLDALVESGANTIDGISFAIDDSDEMMDEARREAIATLLARAELYADAVGVRVGRLVNMSESGGFSPQPLYAVSRSMSAESVTPVAAGELTLSVTVNATFELQE